MSAGFIAAVVFTVFLLMTHGYFLLGALPLLVLKHDTPMDGRFVRGYFDTYYRASMFTAGAAALCLAWAKSLPLAASAAGLALLAAILRRTVIPKMDALRAEIQVDAPRSIQAFRRTHAAAILLNLVQVVLIVWGILAVSAAMR